MIENLIYILIGFASVFVVISARGVFDTKLKQTFAGSSLSYGGFALADNYTNMVSFYEIASKGLLGFGGYVFIAGSVFLVLVWASNLYQYGQAIR
jgi:hypothetical protein